MTVATLLAVSMLFTRTVIASLISRPGRELPGQVTCESCRWSCRLSKPVPHLATFCHARVPPADAATSGESLAIGGDAHVLGAEAPCRRAGSLQAVAT